MGNKNRRQVVASQQEADMARRAEQLRQQGEANFESVYGRKQSGAHDIAGDRAELHKMARAAGQTVPTNNPPESGYFSGVKEMPTQQNPNPAPQPKPKAQAPQEPPQPPQNLPESQINTNPPQEEKGKEKGKEEENQGLPEDPVKRAEYLSAQLVEIAKHPDTLPVFSNPPLASTLLQWKRDHGEIFLLNIGTHSYIYRYIKRQEWLQLLADENFNKATDEQNNERIFDRCCLWPRPDSIQMATLPAGAPAMIVQQIRIQSFFLEPSYVANLTIKV